MQGKLIKEDLDDYDDEGFEEEEEEYGFMDSQTGEYVAAMAEEGGIYLQDPPPLVNGHGADRSSPMDSEEEKEMPADQGMFAANGFHSLDAPYSMSPQAEGHPLSAEPSTRSAAFWDVMSDATEEEILSFGSSDDDNFSARAEEAQAYIDSGPKFTSGDNMGIIPRVIVDLFEVKKKTGLVISLSMVEIYRDTIRDVMPNDEVLTM